MEFTGVKAITLPEGEVKSITRNGVVIWQKSQLPAIYQEVEYLASDGNAYIDTGYIPNNNTNFVIDAEGYNNYGFQFGCYVRWNGIMFCHATAEYGFAFLSGLSLRISELDGNRHILSLNNRKLYVDDVFSKDFGAATSTTNLSLFIFCANQNGSPYHERSGTFKVMSFICDENGISKRKLIACRRKSDNVAGFYDLCGSICPLTNSPFYINAGTGSFIVGTDV